MLGYCIYFHSVDVIQHKPRLFRIRTGLSFVLFYTTHGSLHLYSFTSKMSNNYMTETSHHLCACVRVCVYLTFYINNEQQGMILIKQLKKLYNGCQTQQQNSVGILGPSPAKKSRHHVNCFGLRHSHIKCRTIG